MKKRTLYSIWGALFILCALLGFIQEPQGMVKALLVMLAVGFFVPGGFLLWQGLREKELFHLRLIRNLSAASLAVTLVLLILNFVSIGAEELTGNFLYGLLVIFSAPMYCGQYWIMSLFLWACMLMTSMSFLKKCRS